MSNVDGGPALPTTERVIAENIRDYSELIEALRGRLYELNATMEAVDELAGLPLRYTSKVFAPTPIKTLGKISLGATLGSRCAAGLPSSKIENC